MENHVSGMPLWADILFIVTFLYSIFFITKPVKQAAINAGMMPQKSQRIQIGIFTFYLVYLAYVSALSLKGVFDVNSLPPKVMVWAGTPLLIILFIFIGNTGLFKKIAPCNYVGIVDRFTHIQAAWRIFYPDLWLPLAPGEVRFFGWIGGYHCSNTGGTCSEAVCNDTPMAKSRGLCMEYFRHAGYC